MNSVAQHNKKTNKKTNENPAQTLAERIVSLYASINPATAQLLELIAEFDELNLGERQGFISTANWLNYQCGIGLTAAREKVRVARTLQHLPAVAACFREGRVSYSKVRALTRVATPANEAALLDIARHATAAQAERIFRLYRQTLASAESSTAEGVRNNRAMTFPHTGMKTATWCFAVGYRRNRARWRLWRGGGGAAEVARRALSSDTAPALRRALIKRDRGCRFPGCTHRRPPPHC